MAVVQEVFSTGRNAKIGDNVSILNLPPIKTCVNCATCSKSCYAMFRYGFPSVKARWDSNLKLTKSSSFVDKASIELKYKGSNIVRFHESGDFYNMAYINKCYKLAKQNPNIMFYGYTKNIEALKLNKLQNVNIIYSLIKTELGYVRNYGTKEYCDYLHDNYNVLICPHDKTWKASGKKCMVDCTECLNCQSVCFVEHGRKAKSDTYSSSTLAKLKAVKKYKL